MHSSWLGYYLADLWFDLLIFRLTFHLIKKQLARRQASSLKIDQKNDKNIQQYFYGGVHLAPTVRVKAARRPIQLSSGPSDQISPTLIFPSSEI